MESVIMAVNMLAVLFSTAAFFMSIYCVIKIKAQELSNYEFIPVESKDLFPTDMDKINEDLEDDEVDEDINEAFGDNKRNNKVTIL